MGFMAQEGLYVTLHIYLNVDVSDEVIAEIVTHIHLFYLSILNHTPIETACSINKLPSTRVQSCNG